MGSPFLANSQVGFFYPLNWPVWAFLRTPYAVSASILIHLFIAGLGAYFAGRKALGLGRGGGLVTAVLFYVRRIRHRAGGAYQSIARVGLAALVPGDYRFL